MSLRSALQDRTAVVETAYGVAARLAGLVAPLIRRLGRRRCDRWLRGPERLLKSALFDCRMCGQCVLHSTGMTCPMTCPKDIRNGPCGGVEPDGTCEVRRGEPCVWVQAYRRSLRMRRFGDELRILQPPPDRRLEGTSSWANAACGIDRRKPAAWPSAPETDSVRSRASERRSEAPAP